MSEKAIFFNGIDMLTGGYLQEPLVDTRLAERILNARRDLAEERDLRWWHERYALRERRADSSGAGQRPLQDEPSRKSARDVDPMNLASSGWGVIFPQDPPPGVREELAPLLAHRRSQATREHEHYYRELHYEAGESKQGFLHRLKVESGPAHPGQLPYYLLIVGDPATIPHRFQYLLDMQYAVGRLYFDDPEDYGRYAGSVIAAEKGQNHVRPEMRFFSVHHDDDPATSLAHEKLVRPLAADLSRSRGHWDIQRVGRPGKAELGRLLGGDETPALLFTFGHGLSFRSRHPDQADYQGAILCQNWPGPGRRRGSIHRQHYFAAADIGDDAKLHGAVALLLGCYSAGTPMTDNYPPDRPLQNPKQPRAPSPFVSRLAQRLLSHPNGGALAVVGHVDRIWSRTFGSGLGKGYHHIESCLKDLLDGYSVGAAMDWMNERFAELSTELSDILDAYKEPLEAGGDATLSDARRLASLWRANNDARNLVVLGDPAVYLAAGPRTARAGISLPDHGSSVQISKRSQLRGVLKRLKTRKTVASTVSPTEIVRAVRDRQR